MSELEQSILIRVDAIKKAELIKIDAMKKADEIRRAKEALEAQKHKEDLKKVQRIGLEIVGLLTKYEVPTEDIWGQTIVGKQRVGRNRTTGDFYEDNVYANELIGQGWKLFETQKRVYGIDEDFLSLDKRIGIDEGGTLIAYQLDIRNGPTLELEGTSPLAIGMVNPAGYERDTPQAVLSTFKNEICQDAIARLIEPYVQQSM